VKSSSGGINRNRLALRAGEVVRDSQMVADSPDGPMPIEHVAFTVWLFYQALHESG
jgi:hypothetical protein